MSKFIEKINVPTEIAENEKHLYHVLIVEASFNQAQLEATYSAKVQKYDDRSWLAVKDRLKQIGHTNVYVLHDPKVKADAKPKAKKKDKGTDKGNGDQGGDAGNGADGNDLTPQEQRKALIERAKELGYEGALNAKNEVYEEFIQNAEENGDQGGDE